MIVTISLQLSQFFLFVGLSQPVMCHHLLGPKRPCYIIYEYVLEVIVKVEGFRVCLPKYSPTLVRAKPDLGISNDGPISHSRAWAVPKYTIIHFRDPSCENPAANEKQVFPKRNYERPSEQLIPVRHPPTNQLPFPHIHTPFGGKRN
jgi:hypothetical protein